MKSVILSAAEQEGEVQWDFSKHVKKVMQQLLLELEMEVLM